MKRNAQPTPNPGTAQVPRIMTVGEVGEMLKIPKGSVYEKTRKRRGSVPPLPCRRVGKYLRFIEAEVLDWLMNLPRQRATHA